MRLILGQLVNKVHANWATRCVDGTDRQKNDQSYLNSGNSGLFFEIIPNTTTKSPLDSISHIDNYSPLNQSIHYIAFTFIYSNYQFRL